MISVIIPWFGEHCRGGAERLSGIVYDILTDLGQNVEIATTTSKSFDSDWATGFYRAGLMTEQGRQVRRFSVSARDSRIFDEVNRKLLNAEPVSATDEHVFLHENINSLELNHYISQGTSDAYVYLPYLYGPALFGLLHNPGRNVVIPLLHDEGYARLTLVARSMLLADAAIFLSPAEQALFHEVYGTALPFESVAPIPMCVADIVPEVPVPVPFRYVLYAGRKDQGKNIPFLFEVMERLSRKEVGLVLIGGGRLEIPDGIRTRTLDLGYVGEAEKQFLLKNAVCLLQPSLLESFSIVVAEANARGAPVIVHKACPVLRDYVHASRGGVAVGTAEDAARQISEWLDDPHTGSEVGQRGASFVQNEYSLNAVQMKYAALLTHILGH